MDYLLVIQIISLMLIKVRRRVNMLRGSGRGEITGRVNNICKQTTNTNTLSVREVTVKRSSNL